DGPGSASEKAVAKAARFADMQARYRALRADWDGDDAYDAWMLGEWNNAKLASVSAYHALAPAFRALIERHDGDFEAVYRAAEKLAALDPERRRGCLEALAAGGHPPGCG
ncbi:MAG: aminopeptidase, partial [Gammaproteobacteria bacterium]